MPGSELYEKFMALHTRDGGLVMPNAWDGLSALMLADAGFEAVGTSSVALLPLSAVSTDVTTSPATNIWTTLS
jgi:2-methylisocitrate lyase-like PEP mutase family enzyme